MEIKDKELHRVAVTCIIYKQDQYLITKRALFKKVMPGKWCVPGGGMTVADYVNDKPSTWTSNQWYGSLEKALQREVKEEVNLEIGTPEYLTNLTFVRPDGIPVLCLSFFAPYVSGEVALDDDATEYAWISVEDLIKYDLIDGVDHEIQQVDEILKKRKAG